MSDKKSSDNRRKLLKSIAAGSGAIVAGKSLPESWSRPVVDSVMLPSHAQTSSASCSSLDFTASLSCSDPVGPRTGTIYSIDDTGECLVLDAEPTTNLFPGNSPANTFQIEFERESGGIDVIGYFPTATFVRRTQSCTTPAADSTQQNIETIQATSGASWQVQITVENTATTVSASVVLTPV